MRIQGQMATAPAAPPHGLSGALKLLGKTPVNHANGGTVQWTGGNTGGSGLARNTTRMMQQGPVGGAQRAANTGIRKLQPWIQPGQAAGDAQAALSGAMGPEAQAEAYAAYQASPDMQFLQEQGEKALMRNAAAMGGLGGSNVMKALTRYGQGVASQGFKDYYSRLGDVAGRGMQAQGLETGLYNTKSQAHTAYGDQQARIRAAAIGAAGSTSAAQIASDAALTRDAAQYAYDSGVRLGNNVNSTTSSLANYINQQGAGMSDLYGGMTNNMANLLVSGGRDQAASSGNLASLLGTVRTGSSAQVARLPELPKGVQFHEGSLDNISRAITGMMGPG